MSQAVISSPRPPVRRERRLSLPPLESGDCLHVSEFLRRYEASPDVKKAQLIEGSVHMPSPVRADLHAEPDNLLQIWLGLFAMSQPGLKAYTNATLLLDSENAPQPDAILCSAPKKGSHVWLNEKGYLCGVPELVCEVAASSSSIDLHSKKRAYCRRGIPEYLVWLTLEKRVLWYVLEDSEYITLSPDAKGLLRSRVFPGLVLDSKALVKMDGARVIAALNSR